MFAFLTIFGGVALLLFGVRFLRKGLDRTFGARLGTWMQRLASKRHFAFFSGFGVSLVAPSSTTISLLAVQTVQAGQMTARQMLAVMLGAHIGLTVTVQLIAFRIDEYAPIVILLGMALYQFAPKPRQRGFGRSILGLGFIFLAINIIKTITAESGLAEHQDFQQLVEIARHYPVAIAILAAGLAIALQSSTATIGLVIGLAAAGAVKLNMAIAVVVGANVGLSITTLIVGWKQIDSRRMAVAMLMLATFVAVAVLVALHFFAEQLPQPSEAAFGRWIANTHTGFNVVLAIVGMAALGPLVKLVGRIVPEPPADQVRTFGPRYLPSGRIDGVALALGQSRREIMHMSEIVHSMLTDIWSAMKTNNDELARTVAERDDKVDTLDSAIKRFLARIIKEGEDEVDAGEQVRQLEFLNELETVGDIIDKNISELVLKKIRKGASFSEQGEAELDDFYEKILENLTIADAVFTTRDRSLAQQLIRHKERLGAYESQLRDRHFARLNAGLSESMETSSIHLDLLTHLKRINSSLSHVGYSIVQSRAPADEQG